MTNSTIFDRLFSRLRRERADQHIDTKPTAADASRMAAHSSIFDVSRGRLYLRSVDAFAPHGVAAEPPTPTAQLVFGLVLLPAGVMDERCYGARIDGHGMTMNLKFAQDLAVPPFAPEDAPPPATPLSDFSISNIMKFFAFRRASAPDCLELFVRRSPLPSEAPDHSWFFVAGPAFGGFACGLRRGLYDLAARPAFATLVETADYDQLTPSEVFSEPLWGDSGALGLLSDYATGRHDKAEAARRAAISGGDAAFDRFCEMMDKEAPPLPFYTSEQYHARRAKLGEIASRVNVNLGTQEMGAGMPDLPGLVAAVKKAAARATADATAPIKTSPRRR